MRKEASPVSHRFRFRSALRRGLLALPLLATARGAAAETPAFQLQIRVETPVEGAVIGDPSGTAFVAGSTLAHQGRLVHFDIVFVIDRSHSTVDPSGGDVNGDGRAERWSCTHVPALLGMLGTYAGLCAATPDSVLAAELSAVRTLVHQLDPRTTRIAVVAFSGDDNPTTPDAQLFCPLTTDYDRVESALDDIGEQGPQGATNMYEAVQVAEAEVLANAAAPQDGETTQRILLLLSDGQPTAPFEESLARNRRVAVEAAAHAGHLGLRIDTFGIGPDALSDPQVLAEMARVSDGIFTPVARPGELQSIFEQVHFFELDALRLRNRTTAQDATQVMRRADGSFAALLELAPGRNTIEIYAHASDGSEQTRSVTIDFLQNAPAQALDPRLRTERNLLLSNRLLDLRSRSVEIEARRDAEVRRTLEIHMQEQQAERERLRQLQVRPDPHSTPQDAPAGTGETASPGTGETASPETGAAHRP